MVTVPRLQRYYQSATTSCPHMAFGLLIRQPAPWAPAGVRVRAGRSRRLAGQSPGRGLDCSRWQSPFQRSCPRAEQDLPGSLATHPVTLRRSTTPDDPLRLAAGGASGTAPGRITPKASSLHRFRGYRDASSPAVYASRRALPHAMQDSLPAGGLRLCRAGVEPAGSLREVSDHVILLSRAYPGAISVRSRFQLPTWLICRVAPRAMSFNRERPRHMTMLPGGGSLARVR